ncbi:DUF1634 domain-containing protein [Edaphobacter sp. HDX4]|uniref:DUF1634 domain-containing protein n=1 Tax=Edaphobacter sp. HDX4 TaxID=2794064 RepID=UPI002FE5EC77
MKASKEGSSVDIQDKQLQRLISFTLRSGVLTAVVVGLLGGIMFLRFHSTDPVAFHTFEGAHSTFASPREIVKEAFHTHIAGEENRGLAIGQLGIICLLLTPIIRVALSIVGFAMERDRVYVVITAAVLATLTCSMLLH